MRFKEFLKENATEDAKKTLTAIIGYLKKQKPGNDDTKEMLKMADGIMDYYKKEGSFSPKHAQWIYNTSKAIFKESVDKNGRLINEELMKVTSIDSGHYHYYMVDEAGNGETISTEITDTKVVDPKEHTHLISEFKIETVNNHKHHS